MRNQDPSGQSVPGPCSCSVAIPQLLQITAKVQDINDRERMEAALRQSEARLLEAQRIAHLGNWVWDLESNDLHWSDEIFHIFGLPAHQFGATYEAFLQTVHSDDRSSVDLAVEQALFCGSPYNLVHRIIRPDGEIRYVHERAEVTRNALGHPIRMAGTVQDITERMQAEEQARRLQNELAHVSRVITMGEMATGIAHELNQPLSAIASFAYVARDILAKEPASKSGQLLETLEIIENQSIRAGEIVKRLKRLVRKSPPHRSSVDVNKSIEEILAVVQTDLRIAEIEIFKNFERTLPLVLIDGIQIQQVLLNLIRNAIDAVGECDATRRKIAVSTDGRIEGMIQVAIHDSGPGLSTEALGRVFEAFYTTKEHGLGMGLAISRSIIESHGGRLWAESTSGEGTMFRFILPLTTGRTDAVD